MAVHALIVEDEESILLSLEFLLTQEGYSVTTAQDGAAMPRAAKLVADPQHPPPVPMEGRAVVAQDAPRGKGMARAGQPLDQCVAGFVIGFGARIADGQHRNPHRYELAAFVDPAHALAPLHKGQPQGKARKYRRTRPTEPARQIARRCV